MSKAEKYLAVALESIQIAKEIVDSQVDSARVLLDERQFHSLRDKSLKIASDVSVIESKLQEFQRMGFFANKYAVVGANEKAE